MFKSIQKIFKKTNQTPVTKKKEPEPIKEYNNDEMEKIIAEMKNFENKNNNTDKHIASIASIVNKGKKEKEEEEEEEDKILLAELEELMKEEKKGGYKIKNRRMKGGEPFRNFLEKKISEKGFNDAKKLSIMNFYEEIEDSFTRNFLGRNISISKLQNAKAYFIQKKKKHIMMMKK